jgi:hypothetical protein
MSLREKDETSEVVGWQRKAAWILVIVAVVFWLWFGIGSAMFEPGGWFNWFMHLLIPGGIFIMSAAAAWLWQKVGGILFALEGVIAIGFLVVTLLAGRLNPATIFMMLLTLALPPLLAGILFLVGPKGGEEPSSPQTSNDQDLQ